MHFLADFLTNLEGFGQISPKKLFGFVLIYQIVMSNNYFYYKSDKFQHILLIFWMLSYVKMGFFVFFLQKISLLPVFLTNLADFCQMSPKKVFGLVFIYRIGMSRHHICHFSRENFGGKLIFLFFFLEK